MSLARALRWVAAKLPPPRVIFDRGGRSPYLSRYYLVGAPRMPDGSNPFDATGAPRQGVAWPRRPFGVYLHRFHRGDDEPELHNHPWRWAVALILAGGYVEERRGPDDVVRSRRMRPGMVNVIGQYDFHRVELEGDEAWSLFIAGPKVAGWGFWNRTTGVFLPWREFITAVRQPWSMVREGVVRISGPALLDPADGRPIKWNPTQGWQEP